MNTKLSFLLLIVLLQLSCKSTDPPTTPKIDGTRLILSIEEVSCTEAWVRIQTNQIPLPCIINLYCNDLRVNSFNLSSNDTTVYVGSLNINSPYKFTAFANSGKEEVVSENINANTLNITKEFALTTYRIGLHTSTIYDIKIINENDIWAVGEIYIKDSAGVTEEQYYNIAHWNGEKWELKKMFVEYMGKPSLPQLYAIFLLPDNQIVFSCSLPILPIQNGWKLYHLWDMGVLGNNDGSVYNIWGTSINNLFFSGNKGTIVHYNGSSFQKLNSGTSVFFNDMWGNFNKKNNSYEILTVGPDQTNSGVKKIVSININNTCTVLSDSSLPRGIATIWFNSLHKYYLGGDGLFISNTPKNWIRKTGMPRYFSTCIRGNELNDIVLVGAYGLLMHFNGLTWKNYQGESSDGSYRKVDIKGNIFAAVGRDNEPIITIGRR